MLPPLPRSKGQGFSVASCKSKKKQPQRVPRATRFAGRGKPAPGLHPLHQRADFLVRPLDPREAVDPRCGVEHFAQSGRGNGKQGPASLRLVEQSPHPGFEERGPGDLLQDDARVNHAGGRAASSPPPRPPRGGPSRQLQGRRPPLSASAASATTSLSSSMPAAARSAFGRMMTPFLLTLRIALKRRSSGISVKPMDISSTGKAPLQRQALLPAPAAWLQQAAGSRGRAPRGAPRPRPSPRGK